MRNLLFKWIVATAFFMTIVVPAFGQNAEDALRYSESYYPSNARSAGVANAFGALGANPIAPSINPAGLGLYRQSGISLSPSFETISTESNYLGSKNQDQKFNFNIGNLSLVFTDVKYKMGEPKTKGWSSVSFAMGFNRQQTLHKRMLATGLNNENSILDAFAEQASGTYPYQQRSNNPSGLAYRNWLINPLPLMDPSAPLSDSGIYLASIQSNNRSIQQEKSLESSGGTNDIYFSLGGNYSNQFYIGGTIGIPTVNYEQETTFSETNQGVDQANLNDSIPNFRSMELTESFSTNGAGIYGGLGFIYRLNSSLRLGASIYTPKFFSLEDEYQYTIEAEVEDTPESFDGQESSPEGQFEYTLTTPFRVTANAAYIINDKGFISVDYEMKNPSSAQLSSDQYGFQRENNNISSIYKPIHNIRIGTEWQYDVFAFRGGYAYYTSPFESTYVSSDADGSTNLYTLGFGLNQSQFNLDFAYRIATKSKTTIPYQTSKGNNTAIKEDMQHHNLIMTFTYNW